MRNAELKDAHALIPDRHFTGASSLRGRHLPVPRASAPRTQPRARGVGRARPRLLAATRGLRDPRDTRHGGLPPPRERADPLRKPLSRHVALPLGADRAENLYEE